MGKQQDNTGPEAIAQRAHRIWEEEGRPEGKSDEHWARAESELASERQAPGAVGTADRKAGAAAKPARKPKA